MQDEQVTPTPLPIQDTILDDSLEDIQEKTLRICPKCRLSVAGEDHACKEPGPIPEPPKVGTMFESIYELNRVIASGGMGLVYEARDATTEQTVAIKMLHAHMLSDAFVMRFQREGKAASQLSHPNLLKVYELGVTDTNQPYMVMEFVPGYSLADEIRRSPIALKRAIPIFVQICDALAHAHQRGVLHRDLKPSNILLTQMDDGREVVKIVDFGIAKVLDDDGKITRTGQVLGSPAYMSPEQCSGGHVDNRSDIYSLGCLMFETLTGKPPFVSESSLKIIMHHRSTAPPTLASFMTQFEVPKALDDIFKKVFAKQPDQRYQTVDELKVDLLALEETMPDQLPKKKAQAKKRSKRHRGIKIDREMIMVASVVLGSVVLASGAAFFLMMEPKKSDPVTPTERSSSLERPDSDDDAKKRDKIRMLAKLDMRKVTDQDLIWCESVADSLPELPLSGSQVSDTGMASFLRKNKFSILTKINLDNTAVGKDTCAALLHVPTLQILKLKNTNVKDADGMLIARLKNLEELSLESTGIQDITVRDLSQCPRLSELNLAWTRVTSNACSAIASMQGLKELSLRGTRINNSGLQQLAELRTLTSLDVGSTDIDDKGLDSIGRLERLEKLNLSYTKVNGKALSILKGLPSLLQLDLKGTSLTDKTVSDFNPVTENLDLSCTGVGDGIGSRLAKLEKLTELYVSQTNVSDALIPYLKDTSNLFKLELDDDNISDASAKALAKMRNLTELSLRNTKISDEGLMILATSRSLEKVNVSDCKRVTRKGARKAQARANEERDQTRTPAMQIEFD